MLDPGCIVIGGPLALVDRYYFQMLDEHLRDRLGDRTFLSTVIPGQLEPNAALIGAGIFASRL